MPDDTTILQMVEQVIYAAGLDVTYGNSGVLIGKLPGGPLEYLHKLFNPDDDTVFELKRALGFPPPLSYEKFFSLSDGATLFDNTLFLYGVGGVTTREVSFDNVRPVSLIEQIEIHRRNNPDPEWTEVGALAAATKTYSIQINRDGITALCSPDGTRLEYRTFLSSILTLVQIIQGNCGSKGLIDDSAETLQAKIDSLISQQRQ